MDINKIIKELHSQREEIVRMMSALERIKASDEADRRSG